MLNFKQLINIDGVIFRLQKVANYDSGKDQTTLVELIRIIEGDNIKTFDIDLPFDPFSKTELRETEGKGISGLTRVTEDDISRKVQ